MKTISGFMAPQLAVLASISLTACSDSNDYGNGGNQPNPSGLVAALAAPSGDAQTGAPKATLADPIRIVVSRDGVPVPGTRVTWSATGSGASLGPNSNTTDAQGIAASVWTVGEEPGSQSAQAVVQGASGSPVAFTATAGGEPPDQVTINLLNVGGNRFEPDNVTISAGTTVTWVWVGGSHDVTSAGARSFPSGGPPVLPPKSYSYTFRTPGTYLYFCSVHGSAASEGTVSGMSGTIVVQ